MNQNEKGPAAVVAGHPNAQDEKHTGSTKTDANNPGVPISDKEQKNASGQNQPPKKDPQKEQDDKQQKTGTNR